MTEKRFQGRSALVTGGGSGIGRATAFALAQEGARVMIADIDAANGERCVGEIRTAGGAAAFVQADATAEADAICMVAAACDAHGAISLAVNNVGNARPGGFDDGSLENWNWTLTISLTSTWLSMRHEWPVLRKNGGGAIVNIASLAAKRASPTAPPSYGAAKAGVVHLTRYGAAAGAPLGIRVNSVSPGLVATPLIAGMFSVEEQNKIAADEQLIARAVQPEEVAATVLFLLSDAAAMITGTDTEISGGAR